MAAQIDLLLDVDYATGSSTSGGSWELYAATDEFGLFSLRVPIAGVGAGVTNELPRGRVNGAASDNAGFATFVNQGVGSSRELFFGQRLTPDGQGEQGVFYGVGTLANGSPDFPGQQAGTNDLGPNILTLSNVQGVPWATGGPLGSTGVLVASGVFAPGLTPDFGLADGLLQGSLLTSEGAIDAPGGTTLDVTFTTEVVTDLVFGVATGDYNGNGVVDPADYTLWRDTFGQSVTPLTGADGDGDGEIGLGDRDIWAGNLGLTSPAGAVAIPEPLACWLAAVGCLGSAARRRSLVGSANAVQPREVA